MNLIRLSRIKTLKLFPLKYIFTLSKMEEAELCTIKEYETDSYLFESVAKVLKVTPTDPDKTIFHPQGGGQPDDEGTITSGDIEFKVDQLKFKGKSILHIGKFLNPEKIFEENQDVELKINEEKRRHYARLHSAGHLIDVAVTRLGFDQLEPGKGYHFAKGSYVEYIGNVDADKREKMRDDLNATLKQLIEEIKEEDKVMSKVMTIEEAKEVLGEVQV